MTMDDEKDYARLRCFESVDFTMFLNLAGLYQLPLKKARKVFRLMHSCPEGNAEAIQRTGEWLDEEAQTAQFVAERTEEAFHRGYDATIDPRSRKPATARQRRLNAGLAEAVRRAQMDVKKVQKLQNLFNSERKI
jgi:hypothetical protein